MAIDVPKTFGEWVQRGSDLCRAFKAALRSGDEEGAEAVLSKVEEISDEQTKEAFFVKAVGEMIEDEDFSFVDKD